MSTNAFYDFITKRSLEPVSLGGVHFHINPSNFKYDTEFIHTEVSTLAGYGTFRYGIRAPLLTLDGFTGIAGLDGINRLKKFRALPGVRPQLLPFKYPNRFGDRVIYVYVNGISDSISDQMHLYNSYAIELVEFPRDSQPSVKQLASNIGANISSIISSGPLPLAASPSGSIISAAPVDPTYSTRERDARGTINRLAPRAV